MRLNNSRAISPVGVSGQIVQGVPQVIADNLVAVTQDLPEDTTFLFLHALRKFTQNLPSFLIFDLLNLPKHRRACVVISLAGASRLTPLLPGEFTI
jgi:hypothetical protein